MSPNPRMPAVFSALVFATAALLAGCGGGSGGAGEPAAGPWALRATDDAGFAAYFRAAMGPSGTGSLVSGGGAVPAGTTGADGIPAPQAPAGAFSGTTLQEFGVDEGDLIKSDGLHVFSLDPATAPAPARNTLRRQRLEAAAPDAALAPVDSLTIPFSEDVWGTALYLDDARQQLVVIGRRSGSWDAYSAWFWPLSWRQSATEVALVDAMGAAPMRIRRTLRISASVIGSRRIGSTLYLVLRNYPELPGFSPWWPAGATAANQAVLDNLQPAQLLPTMSVDGGAAQPLVQASSCLLQDQNAVRSADIVTVVGIDLAADVHRHGARCFAGGTEAFYMSERNLYLATTRSAYTISGGSALYAPQTSTDIHKFALDGLDIAYRGSGNVAGHLGFDQNRKSFRMGEHDGMLRVVTQTQTNWGGGIALPMPAPVTGLPATATAATPAATTTSSGAESPGRLTILQERTGELALVGELPNAARPEPLGKPGEQLYASRFIGTRGYLVTYRLTDPLYVLDLSDPADPKVAGELQVDGYSDYLFPVSEHLLLGVGKDARADGSAGDGRFAWYQGVKVSLIDVSDPAHPREAARTVIGRRGTEATVLRDHHGIALQYLGNTVRISMPVKVHETPAASATGGASDYFLFTRTELQRFEIDLAAARLDGRVALAGSVPGERSIDHDRALLWQNQLHWYQNGTWRSAGW